MPPKKKEEKKEEEEARPVEESGTYVFEDGARYSGQVVRKDGQLRRHGIGTHSDAALTYAGSWKDDAMHGEGTLTFASGASYTGSLVEGKMDGKGVYKWADSSFYDGQWRFNRMHGEGTYGDVHGEVWHGRFYNGTGPGLRHPSAAAPPAP